MMPRSAAMMTNADEMANLPEGFGPRENPAQDFQLRGNQAGSMSGLRLARAVESARLSRDPALMDLAPMSVALMMSGSRPMALPAVYEAPSARGPAIQRQVLQNLAINEAAG